MVKSKPRTRTLSLYLFTDETSSPVDVFDKDLNPVALRTGKLPGSQRRYALHLEDRPVHPADWAAELTVALGGEEISAFTSSASAALGFEVFDAHEDKIRVMAATWGPGGRHFLDLVLLEDGFGMKTAMNLIDQDQVRSKDSRSYDDSVKQRRTQSSRLTSFDELEFDPMQEILDHITGDVLDQYKGFASRVSGRYYLQIRGPMKPGQMFEKAEASLEHYRRSQYLKKFPWAENKRSVTNPLDIANLDGIVVDQLRRGAATNFHLAAPTIVDWDEIGGFIHKGLPTRSATPNLEIRDYLNQVDPDDITAEALRSDSVRVEYLDGRPTVRWPIYRSLVAEVDVGGSKYILSGGRWFRLNQEWVNDIETQLTTISNHAPLPRADAHDQREEHYNAMAAEAIGAVLMDKVHLKPSNASSNIELCDVLTPDLEFVHVKKRETSSTLSHLYMQGSVSAQAVTSDSTFREQAANEIREIEPTFGGLERWDAMTPQDIEVVYAVISEERFQGKERLPFFSKVSLCQTADLLKRLRYKVSYANILRPPKPVT